MVSSVSTSLLARSCPPVIARMAPCFIKNSRTSTLCYLILEAIFPHLCHILLIRDKSGNSAQAPGEGITQWHEYQEGDITGTHSRSCFSHLVYLITKISVLYATSSLLFRVKPHGFGGHFHQGLKENLGHSPFMAHNGYGYHL